MTHAERHGSERPWRHFRLRAPEAGTVGRIAWGLRLQQILVGWPEVRYRIQVIDAGSVEKAGKIDRVLGRIHRYLDHSVRDDGDRTFSVATGSPQRPSAGMPGSSIASEIEALPFEVLGEHVYPGWRVPAGARLPVTPRH
jgi:hypothetical protein